MPNRLLRDGICTSDLINALTAEEEVFFYRLLVTCDDFGHADARPAILKAQCFPLKDSATVQRIDGWISGLSSKGMLRRYKANGKVYLAVARWEARIRTHPKFPLPTDEGSEWLDSDLPQFAADCAQTAANGRLGKGKGKGKGAAEQLPLPDGWGPSDQTIERLSREFGLVPEDVARYVAAFQDVCKAKGYRYKDFDAAFSNSVRQDWPKMRDRSGKVVRIASDSLQKRVAMP